MAIQPLAPIRPLGPIPGVGSGLETPAASGTAGRHGRPAPQGDTMAQFLQFLQQQAAGNKEVAATRAADARNTGGRHLDMSGHDITNQAGPWAGPMTFTPRGERAGLQSLTPSGDMSLLTPKGREPTESYSNFPPQMAQNDFSKPIVPPPPEMPNIPMGNVAAAFMQPPAPVPSYPRPEMNFPEVAPPVLDQPQRPGPFNPESVASAFANPASNTSVWDQAKTGPSSDIARGSAVSAAIPATQQAAGSVETGANWTDSNAQTMPQRPSPLFLAPSAPRDQLTNLINPRRVPIRPPTLAPMRNMAAAFQ